MTPSCTSAAGRPGIGWAGGMAMLPRSGKRTLCCPWTRCLPRGVTCPQPSPLWGSQQHPLCPHSCQQGVRRATGGPRGGCAQALQSQPGQQMLLWGALTNPKEEVQQPSGHFTTEQEEPPPATVGGCPRSWQNQGWASSWATRQSPREPGDCYY